MIGTVPQELPAFRLRRAESEYRRREREAAEREAREAQARMKAHARSAQQAEEARRALASPHRSLREALDWLRAEWEASGPLRLHEGADTVEERDTLGSPAWTARWLRWLTANDPDDGEVRPFDPMRRAMLAMTRSGAVEASLAGYLFRLACMGWDMEAAGLSLVPPVDVVYVGPYAEHAVRRLRERMEQERRREPASVSRPEWMDRLRIGRSESQHAAEGAVDGTG